VSGAVLAGFLDRGNCRGGLPGPGPPRRAQPPGSCPGLALDLRGPRNAPAVSSVAGSTATCANTCFTGSRPAAAAPASARTSSGCPASHPSSPSPPASLTAGSRSPRSPPRTGPAPPRKHTGSVPPLPLGALARRLDRLVDRVPRHPGRQHAQEDPVAQPALSHTASLRHNPRSGPKSLQRQDADGVVRQLPWPWPQSQQMSSNTSV
jgi:hypothetical protein